MNFRLIFPSGPPQNLEGHGQWLRLFWLRSYSTGVGVARECKGQTFCPCTERLLLGDGCRGRKWGRCRFRSVGTALHQCQLCPEYFRSFRRRRKWLHYSQGGQQFHSLPTPGLEVGVRKVLSIPTRSNPPQPSILVGILGHR